MFPDRFIRREGYDSATFKNDQRRTVRFNHNGRYWSSGINIYRYRSLQIIQND